ncbi:hypothetical protein [Spiroplasma floricola]|uniref:ABC transporter ATP-binding protein n=1 Tax=Spiroplasma floricola 23-6 TaxID=1336749 RepID=A0A2K8SDR9_9MOLU|nr:hypothetical protein [Spiroplasma floricola]AUB31573.1 ABC transporter ATP-binding protein [Spiroplasma floricola 23-6]
MDSYWREKIKKILTKFKNEGKTIIITVHNIDEINEIIDDYLIIDKGQLVFSGSKVELDIYSKYKIFITKKYDVNKFRLFLKQNNIKSFKYDEDENSLVISISNYKELNYIVLYLIKNNLPLKNLIKLPINMESIYKALDDKN